MLPKCKSVVVEITKTILHQIPLKYMHYANSTRYKKNTKPQGHCCQAKMTLTFCFHAIGCFQVQLQCCLSYSMPLLLSYTAYNITNNLRTFTKVLHVAPRFTVNKNAALLVIHELSVTDNNCQLLYHMTC